METPQVAPTSQIEAEIKAIAVVSAERARRLMFAHFRERLEIHAFGILRDSAEAGDVVQEVFIRSMREARLFDADFHTQAWLYRVTRNLCFNILRDRRRRGAILANLSVERPRGQDPSDLVLSGEAQGRMLALFGRLSDDHRTILLLRYYEDLSYNEIAIRLGVKLGTVMSRLNRARTRMEELLGEGEEPLQVAS